MSPKWLAKLSVHSWLKKQKLNARKSLFTFLNKAKKVSDSKAGWRTRILFSVVLVSWFFEKKQESCSCFLFLVWPKVTLIFLVFLARTRKKQEKKVLFLGLSSFFLIYRQILSTTYPTLSKHLLLSSQSRSCRRLLNPCWSKAIFLKAALSSHLAEPAFYQKKQTNACFWTLTRNCKSLFL